MANLVFLTISLLIGSGICKPADPDYSSYLYFVDSVPSSQQESAEHSAPEEDFVISKRDLVVTKDNTATNLTSEQTILLTDIIAKVEGSLVHTAFNIVSLLRINNRTETVKSEPTESSHDAIEKIPEQSPVIPLFEKISSRAVPATPDKPIHDSAKKDDEENDEVKTELPHLSTVFKQKRSISTTSTTTGNPHSTTSEATQTSTSSTAVATPTTKASHTIRYTTSTTKDSSIHDASTSTLSPSSTHFQASTSSSTLGVSTSTSLPTVVPISRATSAPKNAVKELKETEEELKEKVAEIQADPVILSSRI